MLSDRLRLLEERGFIYRHYEPTIPPAVTYGMTDRMRDITKVLDELDKLARKWAKEDSEHKSKHHAVGSHEKPVPPNARAHHVYAANRIAYATACIRLASMPSSTCQSACAAAFRGSQRAFGLLGMRDDFRAPAFRATRRECSTSAN